VRRPVFWFLWPTPAPGPVDGDAEQVRWIRVCGRGPWRWAFLLVLSAAVVTLSSAALAVVVTRPGWLSVLLSALVILPLVALLARAWVAGTYVSDRGIKVSRILATDVVPWSQVADILAVGGSRWLGLPLRAGGERIVVRLVPMADARDADVIDTHVETASPDLLLRPQAWSAASDRLSTWLRETRS